jgi:hypothetical protein
LNESTDGINLCLSGIFIIEAIIKIMGMGFVLHKTSYLRDGWNCLDFFVVLISLSDVVPGSESISTLKVLRALRILRPLRSINKIKGMKVIINSLIKSVPGLMNVGCFLLFVLSIAAIFGVH